MAVGDRIYFYKPFDQARQIALACLVLAALCAANIHHSKSFISSARPQLKSVDLAIDSQNDAPPSPPQTPLPPPPPPPPPPSLQAWQGPIEPIVLPPANPPVIYRLPVNYPVVFLGIDDGWVKSPDAQRWLIQHKLPFSLFLANDGIKNNYNYFKALQNAGMTVENHTLHHPNLKKLTLAQQRAEICDAADTYQQVFGTRPVLFRPPYGSFNDLTRQAAADCGMKAIIMWKAVATGGALQFQDQATYLHAGDIVLMHFRSEFLQDMNAFIRQIEADHLQVGRLEDWLQ